MVRFILSIGFHRQLVSIFVVFLLALGTLSFSHARQVKEMKTVIAVTYEKQVAVEGGSNFTTQKESAPLAVPNVDAVETYAKAGRKTATNEAIVRKEEIMRKFEQQGRINSEKVRSMAGNRRHSVGNGEEIWKDYFMAFSADYRSPKPHPPKNN